MCLKHDIEKMQQTLLPATYIIAPDNTIVYSYVNADYTQRAEPDDIITAIKNI